MSSVRGSRFDKQLDWQATEALVAYQGFELDPAQRVGISFYLANCTFGSAESLLLAKQPFPKQDPRRQILLHLRALATAFFPKNRNTTETLLELNKQEGQTTAFKREWATLAAPVISLINRAWFGFALLEMVSSGDLSRMPGTLPI
jgi:hypothetical protein